MASRRDELNAYTFAKRRLVAQFLQPSPTGTEEGAPRPLRSVLPGAIVAVVIMAGFGAWGMFKPSAPPNWDKAGENVIVGSKSTTRYVVLNTKGKKDPQLHPVLNLASAELLLNQYKKSFITVDEGVLDKGKIPHGSTVGIPYAPDRLPAPGEAAAKKVWAVCERPAKDGNATQKATFVLGKRDSSVVGNGDRLRGGDLMFVQGPDKSLYVVDKSGKRYEIRDKTDERLVRAVVGGGEKPQRVSSQWLATLHEGDPLFFPHVAGTVGAPAHVQGSLSTRANRVGMVIEADSGAGMKKYVVLPGRVQPLTDFMAKMLLSDPAMLKLKQTGAERVNPASFTLPSGTKYFGYAQDWPSEKPHLVDSVNRPGAPRNVSCNVLRDVDRKDGRTTLSTWAGTSFPRKLPTGSTSAYVTPGSGQLFRQFQGKDTKAGGIFLATDTGLRYAMQANGDSATGSSKTGVGGTQKGSTTQSKKAQAKLGYEKVTPAPVPAAWSEFLPTGPRLSVGSARQPQGS